MIQCDLEGLHASHGKAGHGTVIAVRKRSEGRINEGDQGLRHIVFERRGHVLHRLQHFGRSKGFAGEVGSGLAGAAGVAIRHDDDHRLAASGGKQIVEDEVGMRLPNPSRPSSPPPCWRYSTG